MGLDISIYSVESEQKEGYKFFIANDNIEIFEKHFGKNAIKTKTNQYFDFEAIGINEDNFNLLAIDYSDDDTIWVFQNIADKSKVAVNESDIPLREQDDKVVYAKDIGYQRNGMNGLFYNEYTDDDYFVFAKERLQFIYDNYVIDECKEYFKENFLDKFEDGKTFVTFDW